MADEYDLLLKFASASDYDLDVTSTTGEKFAVPRQEDIRRRMRGNTYAAAFEDKFKAF